MGRLNQTAKGIFEISSWDEKTVVELGPGAKLSDARVQQKFSGDLVGDGTVTWLMCYASEKYARFVGMQRFVGAISGRTGCLVMETLGEFDGTLAKGRWSIVPRSGTGGLAGIAGDGGFEAPHGPKATYAIEYSFEKAVTERAR